MRQQLKSAHVCLVGCGAIGSEVAHLLAQEGIGQFTLIDGDILLPENVARHRCDLSDVGCSKADAMRASILRVNPQARIEISSQFVDDIVHSITLVPHQDAAGGSDRAQSDGVAVSLVIGMSGDEAIEGLLSDICSAAMVPTLHGWLEMQGRVLRLFRCLPGQDVSVLELQTARKDSVPALPRSSEKDQPRECAEVVLPGAPATVHAAANFIVQQVIRLLSGVRDETNHWLFAPTGISHPLLDPRLTALAQSYGIASFRL